MRNDAEKVISFTKNLLNDLTTSSFVILQLFHVFCYKDAKEVCEYGTMLSLCVV